MTMFKLTASVETPNLRFQWMDAPYCSIRNEQTSSIQPEAAVSLHNRRQFWCGLSGLVLKWSSMLSSAGACVLIGSAESSSSSYSSLNFPAKEVLLLQLRAINGYYCDANVNYDLLPSVKSRVLFFAGMKVRVNARHKGLMLSC